MASPPHTPTSSSSRQEHAHEHHTVIIGAGIIGCATAYYLSRNQTLNSPKTIHLVESSPELFASASGKSGGFLAGDWFESASSSLGKLSFRLHKELADEYDGFGNWGYNRSTGISFIEGPSSEKESSNGHRQSSDWLEGGESRAEQVPNQTGHKFKIDGVDGAPSWLNRRHGDRIEILGDEGSVAQVDPLRLSHFLLQQSLNAGVLLHQPAKPIGLNDSGLTIQLSADETPEYQTLRCTHLVIASGAWTPPVLLHENIVMQRSRLFI